MNVLLEVLIMFLGISSSVTMFLVLLTIRYKVAYTEDNNKNIIKILFILWKNDLTTTGKIFLSIGLILGFTGVLLYLIIYCFWKLIDIIPPFIKRKE